MKEDVYGAKIAELLATTAKPLSPLEITHIVGCSKARAHDWIKTNRGMLIAMDTNNVGGTLWFSSANPLVKQRDVVAALGDDDIEGIEVGETLKVAGLKFGPLGIVLTLETAQGSRVRAVASWENPGR